MHKGQKLKNLCARANVTLIYNAEYRPDFMGVELIWARAKRHYYIKMQQLLGGGVPIDHLQVVKAILDDIDDGFSRRCAQHALD